MDIVEEISDMVFVCCFCVFREEIVVDVRVGVDFVIVVIIEEFVECFFVVEVFDLWFKKFEVVVCVVIDDSDIDVVVGVVGVWGLIEFGGVSGDDVWRVEVVVYGICLVGIDYE